MKKIIIHLILFPLLIACNQQYNDKNLMKDNNSANFVSKDTCITFNVNLYDCIFNYMSKIDGQFPKKDWLYYNLYFFDIKSSQYFTIWTFTCFPSYISSCVDTSLLNFYLFTINERKVVLIDKKMNTNSLFPNSKNKVSLAKIEALKKYEGDIYDGSFYFETYKIENKRNVFSFIQIDTAISNFINCQELEITIDKESE